MDSSDDILELPPTDEEAQQRQDCIDYLTNFLIEAEEGGITSVAIFAERPDGSFKLGWTRVANNPAFAAKMLQWSLQKLGMVEQDELEMYVRKDEE